MNSHAKVSYCRRTPGLLPTTSKVLLSIGCLVLLNLMVRAQAIRDANQILKDMQKLSTPATAATGQTGIRTREEQIADYLSAAAMAQVFEREFPGHAGIAEAKNIQVHATIRAAQLGDKKSEKEAERLADEYAADPRYSKDDRFAVAAQRKSWDVKRKGLKTPAAILREYELNARELAKVFSGVAGLYEMFLGVAALSPPARAAELATELLASPAPAHVRQEATRILERPTRIGKKLSVKFRAVTGESIELDQAHVNPTVVFLWDSSPAMSMATWTTLRNLAAKGGVRFIGVNLDADGAPLRDRMRAGTTPGFQAWEPLGFRGAVPQALLANRIPSVFVFGRDGTLRGYGDATQLEALLADSNK